MIFQPGKNDRDPSVEGQSKESIRDTLCYSGLSGIFQPDKASEPQSSSIQYLTTALLSWVQPWVPFTSVFRFYRESENWELPQFDRFLASLGYVGLPIGLATAVGSALGSYGEPIPSVMLYTYLIFSFSGNLSSLALDRLYRPLRFLGQEGVSSDPKLRVPSSSQSHVIQPRKLSNQRNLKEEIIRLQALLKVEEMKDLGLHGSNESGSDSDSLRSEFEQEGVEGNPNGTSVAHLQAQIQLADHMLEQMDAQEDEHKDVREDSPVLVDNLPVKPESIDNVLKLKVHIEDNVLIQSILMDDILKDMDPKNNQKTPGLKDLENDQIDEEEDNVEDDEHAFTIV